MNENHERILRAACSRPVRIREFTEGASAIAVAPRFVAQYFRVMTDRGLMYERNGQFFATTAGRDRIALKDDAMSRAEVRSFTTQGNYVPAPFVYRPGALDFLQCPSRGIG